jgi:hypothetical protein
MRLCWAGALVCAIACGTTDTLAPGGSGSGGAPAGTPDAGGGGAQTPAPPPVSSCAGIAKPDAPPMLQYVHQPWHDLSAECGGAAGDASGTLAFEVNGAHGDAIYFVGASSGAPLGASDATMFGFPLSQPNGISVVTAGAGASNPRRSGWCRVAT